MIENEHALQLIMKRRKQQTEREETRTKPVVTWISGSMARGEKRRSIF